MKAFEVAKSTTTIWLLLSPLLQLALPACHGQSSSCGFLESFRSQRCAANILDGVLSQEIQ